MILTPWAEFKDLDPEALAKLMRGRVLIDPYGCVKGAAEAGFNYITLGVPPARSGKNH